MSRLCWRWMFACAIPALATQVSCGGSDTPATTIPVNPATPAAIIAVSSTTLTGTAGQPVSALPSVKVSSNSGAPVSGAGVTFTVTSGGGTITDATQTTNTSGIATVGSWTLGASAGTNTLTASTTGLTSVTFTVTASAPTAPVTLSVTPAIAAAAPNTTVTFAARDNAGVAQSVTWRVNGVSGGNAQLGVISAAGAYTAPSTIPAGDSIVVTALLTSDGATQRSATVFFIPDLVTKDYYVALPRVVDASRPARTRYLLVPPSSATTVTFAPTTGASVPLTPIGNGVLTFELDAAPAMAGYVTGTLHNFVGRLDYRDAAGGQVKLTNLAVNVRDATMGDVSITSLAADAQRSPHMLNLRADTITINPYSSIVARALQLLGGDQFDFVAVVATATTNNNRVYIGLRNDVRGIGTTVFDNSRTWGGNGRLRGAIAFPIDAFFDMAETGAIHEVGHSWINYATDAVLGPGAPHWPASTMALGPMGLSIAGSNVGGQFPWALTSLGNGTVRINRATPSDRFTPLDLYVMGFVAPDSVPPVYVLPTTANPNTFVDGMISPATTYTINDYVAGQSARVPASTTTQRQFATAVVVLSYGRLLTPSEMAFFDAAAARGETTVQLQSSIGLAMSGAPGFFLATGGRATMRTRLP